MIYARKEIKLNKCDSAVKCIDCKHKIKCSLVEKTMTILMPKISDKREDVFWYEGDIAEIGDMRIGAVGEVRGEYKENYYDYYGLLDLAEEKDWTDRDLELNVEFSMNNWFELMIEGDNGKQHYDVEYDYDGAIELLKWAFWERIKNG